MEREIKVAGVTFVVNDPNGSISRMEPRELKAEQAGLETIDLSRAQIDPDLSELLSEEVAWELRSIPVRRDGNRFVLVEGLHRLEACKALGEQTIVGYLVQSAKH